MLYKMMDVSNGNSNNFQLTTPQLVPFLFKIFAKKKQVTTPLTSREGLVEMGVGCVVG